MPSCVDTEGWDNHSGRRCSDYALEQWCMRGAFVKGFEWTSGHQFNRPESNCCICGKAKTQSVSPNPWPDTVADPRVGSSPVTKPPDGGAAAVVEEPAIEEEDAETSRDERLRALVKQRVSSCAALSPSRTDNFLLAYPRLPRVGNGLLCAVLSACSQRAMPCHGGSAPDPTMCPGGADWRYTDLGAAKLHKEAYGCFPRMGQLPVGSAAGWDKLMGSCATHEGDVAATCSMMQATALPATLMLQHETFFEPQAPPCGWSAAPLRFVALLRDPGERAQSAYDFGLTGCICNFKFSHCTMFTSFRFSTRRAALCDGGKPKHSFHEAVGLLRESGVREWPVATDNEQFVLGRYASAVISNVYSTYYGGYRLPPPGADADAAPAEGGAWLVSPALARATLAHCVAWVGIAEEMPLSLQLLRYELPQFFRNLNIAHPAFGWTSVLNRAGEPASNYSSLTHPFLRSHLLTDDYKLYDIERARLVNRATKFGLVNG